MKKFLSELYFKMNPYKSLNQIARFNQVYQELYTYDTSDYRHKALKKLMSLVGLEYQIKVEEAVDIESFPKTKDIKCAIQIDGRKIECLPLVGPVQRIHLSVSFDEVIKSGLLKKFHYSDFERTYDGRGFVTYEITSDRKMLKKLGLSQLRGMWLRIYIDPIIN